MNDKDYISRSVELAIKNVEEGGQPFGAVLVRNGEVLSEGVNQTHIDCDPTAHAKIQALRNASRSLRTPELSDTTMYASGIPCAVCMAAMINAGVTRVVYCADDVAGGPYGWSTEHLYRRMQHQLGEQGVEVVHLPVDNQIEPLENWKKKFGLGMNDKLKEA